MLHIYVFMAIHLDARVLPELAANTMLFISNYILGNSFLICTIECGTDIHPVLLPWLVSGGYTWILFYHCNSSGKTVVPVVPHLNISDIPFYHSYSSNKTVVSSSDIAVVYTATPLCLI